MCAGEFLFSFYMCIEVFTSHSTLKDCSGNCWAEAPIKIARMTLTIKLDGNWSSFQLANSAPPLCVTDSAIAPSARMSCVGLFLAHQFILGCGAVSVQRHVSKRAHTHKHAMTQHGRKLMCWLRSSVGTRRSLKNCESHIDASHSRQPLVKGERLVRYEVNAVMVMTWTH